MPRKMNPADVKAWKARWERVNAREIEELRRTPWEMKLRQLASMMASIDAFGWREALGAEELQVRERWQKLRTAYARRK